MRKIFLALALLGLATSAQAQNYTVTQGAGTTFGSKLVGGVNYAQMVVCDPTTPAQCTAVDASGRLSIIPNTAFNVAQINGVTVLMGNGATGTGSQRITISNDNTIPTGWPTSALQTSGNSSLTTIATNSGTQATAANQTSQITQATNTNTVLGTTASSVCGTATGTCDLTALIKFLNTTTSTPLDNSSAVINVSTATTTQLVAISASTLVRVTSLSIVAGGTGTIKFVYGTGSSCGTGTTDLTGAYPLTAQAGLTLGSGVGTLFKAPAGNALCVTTSAAVQMSGHVGYQQF